MSKKLPYIVYWVIWDRTNPQWYPRKKWERCATEEKAKNFKKLLLSQTKFIDVWIAKEI